MKNKFQTFHEWIQNRDLEFYKTIVEMDSRREFLTKGLGAAAAAIAGAGLSKAAEPKMTSPNDQPSWKNADLKGPIIEFDKDDYGRTDHKNIMVTMKIPDQIKYKIRNAKDLKEYCKKIALTNTEILFQTILLLRKELQNPNINSKNVYIHAYDVSLWPSQYDYNPSDKNVKFLIRVMYFDPKTKDPIEITDLSQKK